MLLPTDHILKVVEELDLDRIRDAMTALNWKWAGAETSTGIPSTKEIRNEAIRLAMSALEGFQKELATAETGQVVNHWVSSGGLKAEWIDFGDGKEWFLSVSFVLSESNSHYVEGCNG